MSTDDAILREALLDQRARELRKKRRRETRYLARQHDDVRRWCKRRDGSSGAAGPCKRIDPVTGELLEIIPSTDA
jgi:hypothetical protein